MATNIFKNKRQRVKECKKKWLISAIGLSVALSACTNYVGDFGRIDARIATPITESHGSMVKIAKSPDFANPLNFSRFEKKFHLTAHLLMQSPITSRTKESITQRSAINYFISKNFNNMQDRHQAIVADIGKLHNILHSFQKLSQQVLAQDNMRDYTNNSIINRQYIAAIDARHQENIHLIQKTTEHLRQLHKSYIYVVNHSNIVEPTLNDAKVRDKLARFRTHINELAHLRHLPIQRPAQI